MQWILSVARRYREALLYLVFGGLTTAVNYVVYVLCWWVLPLETTIVPNVIAWVVAVLFAYLTNRTLVFRSEARGGGAICRELGAFAGARVLTLVLETVILWLLVDRMGLNNLLVKLGANVLVVVLNYVFSKVWIFRKKPAAPAGADDAGREYTPD